MELDVVYPVRTSPWNEELRRSLRSLVNVPHRRVWLVGHKPRWVRNVGHIPNRQAGTKYLASTSHLRTACRDSGVSDPFIYMNDDFYVMAPIDEMEAFHAGPVVDVLASWHARKIDSTYVKGMRQTLRLLNQLGYQNPLSYELHVPIVVHKRACLEALDAGRDIRVLHKRTMYGNLAGIGGRRMRDVKVTRLDDRFPHDSVFLSTNNKSFQRGAVGRFVRDRFAVPCRYEQPVLQRARAHRTSARSM